MAANALAGGPRSVWLVHLTIGNRTVQLGELASALLGAPAPEELALARSGQRAAGCCLGRGARSVARADVIRPCSGRGRPQASIRRPSTAISTPCSFSASRTRNWNVDQAPRRASNIR